jgi:hypothetical protein
VETTWRTSVTENMKTENFMIEGIATIWRNAINKKSREEDFYDGKQTKERRGREAIEYTLPSRLVTPCGFL